MKTVGSSITAVGIAVLLSALAMPQKTSAQIDYVEASGGNAVHIILTNDTFYAVHKFTSIGNSNFEVTAGGEVEYLIVGGGGGVSQNGGNISRGPHFARPGGGGGGGVLLDTDGTNLTVQTYNITVGAASATKGNPSSAFGVEAPGGGQGGYFQLTTGYAGGDGASGGGGGSRENYAPTAPGSADIGWGYDGGEGIREVVEIEEEDVDLIAGGGGGGAGGLGGNASTDVSNGIGGGGGVGVSNDIDGTSRWFGGGGGGAAFGSGTGGSGGLGGGGNGWAGTAAGNNNLGAGGSGAANTGGGGGGGFISSGGSGIVIIRYEIDPNEPFANEAAVIFNNIVTGSERFTNTNKVKVSHLPDPVECVGHVYNRYQVTKSDDPDLLTGDWKTEAEIKALEVEFDKPGTDSLITLYLWYTNATDTVPLQRASGEIIYTSEQPVPFAVPVERDTDGFTVRFTGPELDAGSSHGTALGEAMVDWHQRFAQFKSGVSTNYTPGEAYVTLFDPGKYTLELVLINEAGNVATGEVAVTLNEAELPENGDYYVAAGNLNAEAPYDTWPKAAATIQDAVDRLNTDENDGAVIRVAAGIYAGTGANVVALTRPLSLLGASGNRDNVIIDGEGARRGISASFTTADAHLQIEDLTVTDGYVGATGGAGVYLSLAAASGSATLARCAIVGNRAGVGSGGGLYAQNIDDLRLYNCAFEDNRGASNGGGIYIQNNVNSFYMENSRITGNHAGSTGGGIYTRPTSLEIRNILIANNTSGTAGGGWYHTRNPSTVIADNVTVVRNETFGTSNPVGGVQFMSGTSYLIHNTIIYWNVSPSFLPNYWFSGSSGTMYNSCAGSGTSPALPAGQGNITSDPWMGEDPEETDFRLPKESPAVDAGTNLAWMVTAVDLAGRPRIDTDAGIVDMGAYEYHRPIRGIMILVR